MRKQFSEMTLSERVHVADRLDETLEESIEDNDSCAHGVAWDVHCCHCHSGFLFDWHHVCVNQEEP